MKFGYAFGIAGVCMAVLAGCSTTPAPTPTPTTFTVHGQLDLHRTMISAEPGAQCGGIGGYSDIQAGTQVRITDAIGTVVAIGNLDAGIAVDTVPQSSGTDTCRFSFDVADVPDSGTVYGVEVAHRGVVSFPRAQAGAVRLKLGW